MRRRTIFALGGFGGPGLLSENTAAWEMFRTKPLKSSTTGCPQFNNNNDSLPTLLPFFFFPLLTFFYSDSISLFFEFSYFLTTEAPKTLLGPPKLVVVSCLFHLQTRTRTATTTRVLVTKSISDKRER